MADPSKLAVAEEQVEEENPETFDDGAPRAPIIPEVTISSGEDEDEVLWEKRCKLYRSGEDTVDGKKVIVWKERGLGEAKLLLNKAKNYVRFLMRREGTLKICAHHVIIPEMELRPMTGSDKAFVWSTPADYADGGAQPENLAIRFGQVAVRIA